MTLSKTEEYNTGAYHSHADLKNPHKEREIKRVCRSEPFIKPRMSLSQVKVIPQKTFPFFKFKKPQNDRQQTDFLPGESIKIPRGLATEQFRALQGRECLREEKNIGLQDNDWASTDNSIRTLPQKNKSEWPLFKKRVRSEKKSKKADGLPIPKKEWENITRPSAKVILDPNTANPTLMLSVDRRSVRTMTYDEFQSSKCFYEYQKGKHQYNGWICVQAQEGYSTGRHYWEVDVKGKCDWRIGVVKESAKRKGFIKLNTTEGYWTLRLQLGSFMALTEPVTKLNQAPPSKIGVHLDLEEGQVSFYDAKKRKDIYTFNAEFEKDEIIYPVFGTVETDKPLKII